MHENLFRKTFRLKDSLITIITTIRGLKHRSTQVAPFEAYFLSGNLSYNNILCALDALTITDKKPLISEDADDDTSSDEEISTRRQVVESRNTKIAQSPLFLNETTMIQNPQDA